jgi:DNA-binding XRE family transcriptional regulator
MLELMPRISGEKLRRVRDERLLSQRELAKALDVAPRELLA